MKYYLSNYLLKNFCVISVTINTDLSDFTKKYFLRILFSDRSNDSNFSAKHSTELLECDRCKYSTYNPLLFKSHLIDRYVNVHCYICSSLSCYVFLNN